MRIRFYANMRTTVGLDALDIVDLDGGTTLGNLLASLTQRFPQIRPHLFNPEGNLRQDVPIFINGRNPRLSGAGLDVPIASDAVISLFSPIFSGRMNVEVLRDADIDTPEQIHED